MLCGELVCFACFVSTATPVKCSHYCTLPFGDSNLIRKIFLYRMLFTDFTRCMCMHY